MGCIVSKLFLDFYIYKAPYNAFYEYGPQSTGVTTYKDGHRCHCSSDSTVVHLDHELV